MEHRQRRRTEVQCEDDFLSLCSPFPSFPSLPPPLRSPPHESPGHSAAHPSGGGGGRRRRREGRRRKSSQSEARKSQSSRGSFSPSPTPVSPPITPSPIPTSPLPLTLSPSSVEDDCDRNASPVVRTNKNTPIGTQNLSGSQPVSEAIFSTPKTPVNSCPSSASGCRGSAKAKKSGLSEPHHNHKFPRKRLTECYSVSDSSPGGDVVKVAWNKLSHSEQ